MEFTVMDTNNPGKNPASDGTVAAIHQVSSCLGVSFKQTLRPVVLYEYKPLVHTNPRAVSGRDLTELLIQGYYCFRKYEIDSCLLCLTDLHNWHYIPA